MSTLSLVILISQRSAIPQGRGDILATPLVLAVRLPWTLHAPLKPEVWGFSGCSAPTGDVAEMVESKDNNCNSLHRDVSVVCRHQARLVRVLGLSYPKRCDTNHRLLAVSELTWLPTRSFAQPPLIYIVGAFG